MPLLRTPLLRQPTPTEVAALADRLLAEEGISCQQENFVFQRRA